MDGREQGAKLVGLFKQHFTFAMALTAAQRCVLSAPDAVVSYILATAAGIALLMVVVPAADTPGAMLVKAALSIGTQVLSSLLGAWLTSMVGTDASADKLAAAAALGLMMVWLADRSLGMAA
jgi:hypothetical protein